MLTAEFNLSKAREFRDAVNMGSAEGISRQTKKWVLEARKDVRKLMYEVGTKEWGMVKIFPGTAWGRDVTYGTTFGMIFDFASAQFHLNEE